MTDSSYNKQPKTFAEQLVLLKKRGLIVDNPAKAERVLENISYNRLSNYWEPFLREPKDEEIFQEGVHFKTIFRRYQFDSELRTLVFNAIEQIEVALRTQLIYHLSHQFNSGYGYREVSLYQNETSYFRTMSKIADAEKASRQTFVEKFKRKYTNEHLPSWKSFELLSFRTLYNLYANLKKSDQKLAVSNYFGLHHTVFESWLNTLVYLRNICAHHARFWNVVLTYSPVWPKKTKYAWIDRWENEPENLSTKDKRLKTYAGLCIIQYCLTTVNPYNKFSERLFGLLQRFKEIPNAAMGAPENWQDQPLWNRKNS
jgi:abortive infection bacteriophage resistance protein